ncbi:MAG: IS3 family transposase [Acidobacteria bacterium]|nr:IS3 family transposase [Acidobacteriota bacterium]
MCWKSPPAATTRGVSATLRPGREEDAALTERIRAIHQRSRATYGAPRVDAELRDQGTAISRKRVARLMHRAGLKGISRRQGPVTTIRNPEAHAAQDLVRRDFRAAAPNKLWVADITYIPTWAGFLYLAVVLDSVTILLPNQGSPRPLRKVRWLPLRLELFDHRLGHNLLGVWFQTDDVVCVALNGEIKTPIF